MSGAGSPNESADPGNGRQDHVYNRAEHENLKSTVPIAEPAEEETEGTIAEAEDEPADQTRSQEIARRAEEAKNGHCGEKTENRRGSDVALQGKTLQERHMIGDHQPDRKNQSEADADIDTGADSRVAQEMKPTIAGQV